MYGDIDHLKCWSNGNYLKTQYTAEGDEYCVDDDGFLVTC
jgi:hypothetical protein